MEHQLNSLTIRGFKSIRELDNFELKNLNVLIGANGAGKSNLIAFFRMLHEMMEDRLSDFVINSGGISDLLYNGRKVTSEMSFEIRVGYRIYCFVINPDTREGFYIASEHTYDIDNDDGWSTKTTSPPHQSQFVADGKANLFEDKLDQRIYTAIRSWKIYHFHDTSGTAGVRHAEIVEDSEALRTDAANLAPFLLSLRQTHSAVYAEIVNTCRLVIPYLDDFLLRPQAFGPKTKVALSWKAKGSDYPMQPYHLSDGSLRFICLATALLQPNPPALLIIDEPELGLHPEAIRLVGELIQNAAQRTQIIVATQSPLLVDQFSAEDIVVVKRHDGQSTFERLNEADLKPWLETYSLGELWTKNVIAGGTTHE